MTTIKHLILLVFFSIFAGSALTGCGFHLRGLETTINYRVDSAILDMSDDPTTFPLKQPLITQLESININVADGIGKQTNQSNHLDTAIIQIDNVKLRKYELVGILTEVRLVLSADVTYRIIKTDTSSIDGKTPLVIKSPIQVERSYQFNEANVSVEDQQGEQVKSWLYEHLAQRITDQYMAINLPKIPSNQAVSK